MLEQRVNAHSGPVRVELGPFRHAVDVHDKRLRRKLQEVVPRPGGGPTHEALDRQRPTIEGSVRRRPGGEHREIAHDVLAGRDAVWGICLPPPSAKGARDEAIHHASSFVGLVYLAV